LSKQAKTKDEEVLDLKAKLMKKESMTSDLESKVNALQKQITAFQDS